LIAKTRGDVGNGPDCGIVEAPLETDGAERGKAVRYANPKANLMAPPTPRLSQRSDSLTHFECHQYGLECGVLHRNRIVKHHHNPIASITLKRAAVLDDYFADCRMIIAQQSNHVFWVCTLGEPRKAA